MTSEYDEWAAARATSLLAFAVAVLPGSTAADAAVARALDRLRRTWSRTGREDPDLEARRLVARWSGRPRRAAAVLRLLEGRSDAEIADVLRCSEAAARRLSQRGLVELRDEPGWVEPTVFRADAMARAGAATTAVLTLPPSAPQGTRRQRGPWATAVAVLALVAGTAYAAHLSRSQPVHYPRVVPPTSWRDESYAGVEAQVPGTWGWGSSPIHTADFPAPGHLASCGADRAAVQSREDHSSYISTLTGFVGRPSVTDQACVPWESDGSTPSGDALWFASPLPVGVKVLGPVVAETRAVGGQHVTVFASDPALRRAILGTAQEIHGYDGNGCPTRAVDRPSVGPRGLVPKTLSVCIYSQDTGASTLLYSAALPDSSVERYVTGLVASADAPDPCATPQGSWVALGLTGAAGTRWDVANLGCGRIELGHARSVALSRATVAPWALAGVPAYLSLPSGTAPSLDGYFRAPSP